MGKVLRVDEFIGKKFNRLTILKIVSYKDNQNKTKHKCNCMCDCGKIIECRIDSIIRGITKSCGCLKVEIDKNRVVPYLNIPKRKETNFKKSLEKIGEIFNMLEIINVENYKNKQVMVCKCSCGNLTKQIYADLKSGKVKSCGCYKKEQASKTGSIVGLNNFKSKYKWYFIKNDNIINCRSGYEVIYANYLIKNNINFEYEPTCFKLENGKRYTPDFYLIDTDEYIEIKGSFKANENSHQKENIDIFKTNYNIVIMYWNDIVEKCDLSYKSYNTYLRQAKKLKIKEEDYLNKI